MKKFIIEESEVKRILSMHKALIKEQFAVSSDSKPPYLPAAGKPEAGKPVVGKPAAGTSAAGTSAAGTPATGTPPAVTPPAGKPASPEVDQSLQKLREFVIAGCLSNGKIYLNNTKNTYFYRGVKQSTKQEIDFFPDMTYNFVDGSKKGKWFCNSAQKTAKESNESNDRKLVGFTPEQKKLILKYTNYRLKSELGLDEIGSWEQFTLNFPDGSGSVILYKDPTSQSDVEFKNSTDEKTKTLIPSKNRAEVCRKKIQDFADSANKKLKLPMSQINTDKSFVMACRDQFGMKYNDLGVTKKNLEYLTGQRDGLDGYKLKVGSPYRL
jgi:hypothetical protein